MLRHIFCRHNSFLGNRCWHLRTPLWSTASWTAGKNAWKMLTSFAINLLWQQPYMETWLDIHSIALLIQTCSLPVQNSQTDQSWKMLQSHVHSFVYRSAATLLVSFWRHPLSVHPGSSLQHKSNQPLQQCQKLKITGNHLDSMLPIPTERSGTNLPKLHFRGIEPISAILTIILSEIHHNFS
jgi:hypothetical protein